VSRMLLQETLLITTDGGYCLVSRWCL